MILFRCTVWIGVDLTVESENFTAGQITSQMVKRSSKTEPDLENNAGLFGDLRKGPCQTRILGLKPEVQFLQPGYRYRQSATPLY
jgi:hypothetical protein